MNRLKLLTLGLFIILGSLVFAVPRASLTFAAPVCDPTIESCPPPGGGGSGGGSSSNSNPLNAACQGSTSSSAVCRQANTQGTSNPVSGAHGLLNTAANLVALATGIGALIMILIGAFFYVTSAGNAESAAKAKARIVAAFIGLVVVALAWSIVRLITDRVIK